MILFFADRVDMVEGLIEDVRSGHFPNFFQEMGLKAELKHNKAGFAKRILIPALAVGVISYLVFRPKGHKKRLL